VDVEDKEAFFMSEVARGETLCQDGMLLQSNRQTDKEMDFEEY
jgi:hypothetical protein